MIRPTIGLATALISMSTLFVQYDANAQTASFSLQGKIAGVPDGTSTVELLIWDAPEGGNLVASATVEALFQAGVFSILPQVGSNDFTGTNPFDGTPRWWSIVINDDVSARLPVARVPEAAWAASGGRPPSGEPDAALGNMFYIHSFDTRGRRFVSRHDSGEFFGIAAFYDEIPDFEPVPNWLDSGTTVDFYNVAGGPNRHSGFGTLLGPISDSSVTWFYAPENRSGFQVRRILDFQASPVGPDSEAVLSATNDGVAIGGDRPEPGHRFTVRGGTSTHFLTITGGSDLAESFPAGPAQPVELKPGLILSIDPANPGALRVSNEPYDTRVAGVYSGANGLPTGMLMGKDGCELTGASEHALPLAMTGRVWVYADESAGAIQPGDRLTTSGDMPGHAIRVPEDRAADGAVIGKAMTPMDTETGMVLVLVNLQ